MEIKQPMISVIMPVYNGEKYIKEAIESVLSQTYTDFEFIIINDGSNDCSENIILSYEDNRIVYLKNQENLKLIKTLNKGVSLSKGKYIARMDADDICFPHRFEKQINYLESNLDCSMVSVLPIIMNDDGTILYKSRFFVTTSPQACRFASFFESPIVHPGCIFRADELRKYQYRDCSDIFHVEDYDLWCRMFADGKRIESLNDYLLKYRVLDSSICKKYSDKQRENALNLSFKAINEYFTNPIKYSEFILNFDIGKNNKTYINKSLLLILKLFDFYCHKEKLSDLEQKEIHLWIGKYFLKRFSECTTIEKLKVLFSIRWRIILYVMSYSYKYFLNR